ncbi:superfamily II DNA or RNA helicase [Elusimicrobium posterum]|uniref:DEAD/DEAH box helicase family protein n=1 Tax=Elusimicrobium posterum TaxID=3116653 RepID=UPI003C711F4F
MQKILSFKGQWRSYQERVLSELSAHLLDKKLHIVAAPGAGKTTLGIEVIAHLNMPALILAPTLTIRNQWIERITTAFLTVPAKEVISTDLRNPKKITVITYQALLAGFCKTKEETPEHEEGEDEVVEKNLFSRFNKQEADAIIEKLKAAGVDLLCFDEAHHLRNEWWKALDYLTENLKTGHTLSLTATPPYDVNYSEWQRYENLCGPIDALISIPELVKKGDLCPHQDFIHFSKLRDNENKKINDFDAGAAAFLNALIADAALPGALANTRFFTAPKDTTEDILDDADFFVSIASYLKVTGQEIHKEFLKIFDSKLSDIPAFSYEWMEKFLTGLFFTKRAFFPELEENIAALEKQAKAANIIVRRKISLQENPSMGRIIACSLGKIDSIKDIVELEANALGKDLRMVILADFIRLNCLGKEPSMLGVVPIFEAIKRMGVSQKLNLAVLTGQIVIIPAKIEEDFKKELERYHLTEKNFSAAPVGGAPDYIKINPSEATKNVIVSIITHLFNKGAINILAGTQALLGEGWDAPSINSLILSSTVSSFMLSNQMRGRAIRIDKNNPGKVANIWHLVSVKNLNFMDTLKALAPGAAATREEERDLGNYTYDFMKAVQRFQCYEGPTYAEPYSIESGIFRLGLNVNDILEEKISLPNSRSKALGADRQATARAWEKAFSDGYNNAEVRHGLEVKTPRKETFVFSGTMRYVLFFYATVAVVVAISLGQLGSLALFIGLLFFIIMMAKPLYRFLRCGSVEGTLRQVARCVLETMYSMDIVKSNIKTVGIHITEQEKGKYFFNFANLTHEENNQLVKALREVLEPINSPRYIIERLGNLYDFLPVKDYHAVPEIIGKNKKHAETFELLWKRYISPCNLIFTRTAEGRRTLLKARKKAFSSAFRKNKIHKLSKWG